MAEFPLLPIPTPVPDQRPPGPRVVNDLNLPTRARQGERLQPVFQRLRNVFDGEHDPVTLREDPAGIAPERALVLEVAGAIDDFQDAARRIAGLEYLGDEETDFEPDTELRRTRQSEGPGRPSARRQAGHRPALPRNARHAGARGTDATMGSAPGRGAPAARLRSLVRPVRPPASASGLGTTGPRSREHHRVACRPVGSTYGSRPRRNRAVELSERRAAAAIFSPLRASGP